MDFVFLGSSRVQNHIVTELVESQTSKKALNLGVQGGRLDDVFLMLKILKENEVFPEKVFIQVDYLYNFEGPSVIVGCESLPYIKTNPIVKEHIKENNPSFAFNYYIPFYRYASNDFKIGFREFFCSLLGKKTKLNLEDGFEGKNEKFKDINYKLPDSIIQKNTVFIKIDEFCKLNNIDITYFCAPFCSRVYDSDFIEKLKVKIPELKDFSKSIPEEKYFKDCGHLNEKGAYKFTQMLIDECINEKK
ncbi:hypothetical protein [Flavobacterium enshiense]|uniref:hypothetical protein n=1 Tax=Flavobacterium enshiense TaxID=1341165 RepID=UPI00103A5D0A|nr:hypothetical protein [Flavobacterium enshiense]